MMCGVWCVVWCVVCVKTVINQEGDESVAKRSLLTLTAVLLLVMAFSISPVGAHPLASAKLELKAVVPAMQKLTVLEPLAVSFFYPWGGLERGQSLLLSNKGGILVETNSDWALTVEILENSGFKIFIRPAQNGFAKWIAVDRPARVCSGTRGSHLLSFDLKVEEAPGLFYESSTKTVRGVFTIAQN